MLVGVAQVPSFLKKVEPEEAIPIAVFAAEVKSEIFAEVSVGISEALKSTATPLSASESILIPFPALTLRILLVSTSSPSPTVLKGLEVTALQATPVIKPLSLVRSLVFVGTVIFAVTLEEALAVKVLTVVPFR